MPVGIHTHTHTHPSCNTTHSQPDPQTNTTTHTHLVSVLVAVVVVAVVALGGARVVVVVVVGVVVVMVVVLLASLLRRQTTTDSSTREMAYSFIPCCLFSNETCKALVVHDRNGRPGPSAPAPEPAQGAVPQRRRLLGNKGKAWQNGRPRTRNSGSVASSLSSEKALMPSSRDTSTALRTHSMISTGLLMCCVRRTGADQGGQGQVEDVYAARCST